MMVSELCRRHYLWTYTMVEIKRKMAIVTGHWSFNAIVKRSPKYGELA